MEKWMSKVEELELLAAPKGLLAQGGPGPVMTAEQEIAEYLWNLGL